jgi:hypothetical protein
VQSDLDMEVLTGFNWLNTRSHGGLLWTCNEPLIQIINYLMNYKIFKDNPTPRHHTLLMHVSYIFNSLNAIFFLNTCMFSMSVMLTA